MLYHAHAFVDGAYLRAVAKRAGKPWANPYVLAQKVIGDYSIQSWAGDPRNAKNTALARVTYYDARGERAEALAPDIEAYWMAVELLPDTQLGFGWLRPSEHGRARRQKAVDTLIAVDMLVGAFTGVFKVALLIAGDADFVPVVDEVKRRGVMVVLATDQASASEELRRCADRVVLVGPARADEWFPTMRSDGNTWQD